MPRFLKFLREFWPMPLPLMIHLALALFAQRTRIPTSARSIGFCVIWVCISSSSSSAAVTKRSDGTRSVGFDIQVPSSEGGGLRRSDMLRKWVTGSRFVHDHSRRRKLLLTVSYDEGTFCMVSQAPTNGVPFFFCTVSSSLLWKIAPFFVVAAPKRVTGGVIHKRSSESRVEEATSSWFPAPTLRKHRIR